MVSNPDLGLAYGADTPDPSGQVPLLPPPAAVISNPSIHGADSVRSHVSVGSIARRELVEKARLARVAEFERGERERMLEEEKELSVADGQSVMEGARLTEVLLQSCRSTSRSPSQSPGRVRLLSPSGTGGSDLPKGTSPRSAWASTLF